MNKRNNEAMSTEDFLRQVVFNNGGSGGEMDFRQVARPFAGQAMEAQPFAGWREGAAPGGGTERGSALAEARGQSAGKTPALFRIRCRTNNRGKLTAKGEGVPGNVQSWEYAFAPKGHLVKAQCNGRVEEEYAYNEAGQRVRDRLRHLGRERQFRYNRQGQLVEAGGVRYYYASDGSLRCKEEGRRSTYYEYGKDSRLDAARLPSGDTITYEYGNSLLPERILWDGRPVAAYQWQGPLQLARFLDRQTDTTYTFHYEGGRLPMAVTVAGEMTRYLVQGAGPGTGGSPRSLPQGQAQPGSTSGGDITLRIGTDQVGSVRTLSDGNGILIKEMAYDSFGNVTRDTLPQFFFPLGFAGGLTDPHTGFIRFGFRDYDPVTGRFTAKDPLGDTGGDHDLYDYCVDDPVSFVDPEGLAAHKWNEGNPSKEDTEDPAGLKAYRVLKKVSAVIDVYDQEKELTYDIANTGTRIAGFLADSFAKMFGYPHKTDVQGKLEKALRGTNAFLRGDSPALQQIYDEATGKKKKGTIEDAFKK